MNGRLYDPLLRRFLNADENIQDPYNTQNYNKYGYVMNNPLMFNDPSGEFLGMPELISAMVIATIIVGFSYTVMTAITGQNWDLGKFFKTTLFGAASAAVTYGIGSVFVTSAGTATQIAKQLGEIGTIFVQGTAHALAQGTLSLMQGENFGSAFTSGLLGSLGASAFSSVAGNFANSAVGTIASGAVLGGVGSELTGGNFWQGAVIGGFVAGFNHVMHRMVNNEDPLRKQLKDEFEGTGLDADSKATFCDWESLTEKLPTLKNLLARTKSEFSINDKLGSIVPAKQVGESNKIQVNTTLLKTKLNYAYTLGHEMIHVFDSIYNYSIIMNILGRTTLGSHGYGFYKEYRSYMWMYNNGDNINVNSYLKAYIFDFNQGGVDKVYKNLNTLNSSVINP